MRSIVGTVYTHLIDSLCPRRYLPGPRVGDWVPDPLGGIMQVVPIPQPRADGFAGSLPRRYRLMNTRFPTIPLEDRLPQPLPQPKGPHAVAVTSRPTEDRLSQRYWLDRAKTYLLPVSETQYLVQVSETPRPPSTAPR